MKNGFTLIEVISVMFIAGLLISIVLVSSRFANQTSRGKRADADILLLTDALDQFRLRFGDYPKVNTIDDLLAFEIEIPTSTSHENDSFVFSNLLPRTFSGQDPWGKKYRYKYEETIGNGPGFFSIGRDK